MTTSIPENRVFLSYAHENLDMVRSIYTGLKERKLNVWFDKDHLKPGSWKRQIEEVIPHCRYFVICISDAALKKTGFGNPGFQGKELQFAYEIARVQPDDAFTIVSVRLEDCGRGDHRLSPFQQYDLFDDFEKELDHLAVNLGGLSLADKLSEDIRTKDEKIIERLSGKAETFYYAGDFEKSLDVYTSMVTLYPDDANAWSNKGVALSALGQHDDAEAWYNKGKTLSYLGRKDEAIEAVRKALAIFERMKSPHVDLVREALAELNIEK